MNLKVAVNLNRVTVPYLEDFEKARQYFLKHGVSFEFIFKNVSVTGYRSEEIVILNGEKRFVVFGAQNLVAQDPKTDIDCFVFNLEEWSNPPGSQFPLKPSAPTGSCFMHKLKPFVNISTYKYNQEHGLTVAEIEHELMHALVILARLKGFAVIDFMDTYVDNFNPDSPTGNFSQTWKSLEPFIKSQSKSTWKFFKPEEKTGSKGKVSDLNSTLVDMLDKAAQITADLCQAAGIKRIPYILNSGYRNEEHNEDVGGVEDSSHVKRLAVDIRAKNSIEHFFITKGLMGAGFKRISRKYPNHIHADIDSLKPQNVLF